MVGMQNCPGCRVSVGAIGAVRCGAVRLDRIKKLICWRIEPRGSVSGSGSTGFTVQHSEIVMGEAVIGGLEGRGRGAVMGSSNGDGSEKPVAPMTHQYSVA